MRPSTISKAHRKRYADYYAAREIPLRQHRWHDYFERIAEEIGAATVLDYGCGPNASLAAFSGRAVTNYDPGVSAYSTAPVGTFDLVVCNQVLEHIEPECIDAVLDDVRGYAGKAALISVSTEPSTKLLDGMDWHSFVKEPAWWHVKFIESFPGCEFIDLGGHPSDVAILWRRDAAW